jgi:RNA polymerase sigma-70 factor (ECF subfamily)
MVRDEEVARDLAQDTFIRAFQALGSFRGEARLTTWILAIARNVALNRARRLKLERRWQAEAATPLADFATIQEPVSRRLMTALDELPAPQREAVVLYYVEDLGIEEVAALTRRPANTIKSDLHRARATLRAAMQATNADAEDRG